MNIGSLMLLAAFGSAGAALAAWLLAWSGNTAARRVARPLFAVMTLCLAVASIVLLVAILSDDFSIPYVQNYSSRALPTLYKVSAFWGGQEGTILLWALLQGLIGLAILKRRDEWEPAVMSFLLVPQILLLTLLLKMKPFQLVPPPPDGNGLNPLLQDPWMAIHPPIVFVGYAALVAPFAFALAALARRNADAWVPRVLPWSLVSVLTLGLGLFIGGFWAYKVLGWGGYWGWDPVENSSLAPWLVVTALVHGLLTQRAHGSLKRTNLILAALSYVLVLYSTYMTRSGVLADFSVHSFGEGDLNTLLVVMMIVCAGLPAALLALRWKDVRSKVAPLDLSLSPMMIGGIVLLGLGTALLVLGTSWPLLSRLFGEPSSPGPGFYNAVSLPVGVAMAALLLAAPLMGWLPTSWRGLLRQTAPGLAAGIVVAALPPAFGLWPKGGVLVLLFLAASVAALVASVTRVARQARHGLWMTGAGIAHAGLALMFIGIVTTSAFDRMEPVTLAGDRPASAFGNTFTLNAYVPPDEHLAEPHFEVAVVPDSGAPYTARPVMFRDGLRGNTIARPHITRSLLGDLYIAPVSHREPEGPSAELSLKKNETQQWGPYALTFRQFQSHAAGGGGMSVGALVEITRDGRTEPVTFVLTMGAGGVEHEPVALPFEGGARGTLAGMQVESATIRLAMEDPSREGTPAILTLDVSSKPLVNALWLGILLVALGSSVATVQRTREARALAALPERSAERAQGRLVGGVLPLEKRAG